MTRPTIGTVAMGDTEAEATINEHDVPPPPARIADAMELCDWSGCSIGNKEILKAAVQYLRHCDELHKAVGWVLENNGRLPMSLEEKLRSAFPDTSEGTAALSTRPAQEPVAWLRVARMTPITGEEYNSLWLTNEEDERGFPVYRDAPCDPAAPQPVLSQPEVKADVKVKSLEWDEYGAAFSVFGTYGIAKVHATKFRLSFPGLEREAEKHPSLEAAKSAAQADYEQRILSALCPLSDIPAQAGEVVPSELCRLTFAVQHNPNCPSPWLVRLPGKGPIDMLPYGDPLRLVKHQTGDILGFGKTFEEAARAVLAATASEGSK